MRLRRAIGRNAPTLRRRAPQTCSRALWAAACVFQFTVQLALAGEPRRYGVRPKKPVPEQAEVSLQTDGNEFLLGENVLIHFVVANTGAEEFTVETGGDYRGATRELRYRVTATDEQGQLVEDPDLTQECLGGMVGETPVKPGAKITISLALMRYCRIERPGTYTIRATHDLGWVDTADRKVPVAETTITFRMPNPEQAEQVVAAMEKLPQDPDRTRGEKSPPYRDFTCLQQPVYLPPLMHRAEAGDKSALQGLAAIATPEATVALINLARADDPALSLEAAMTLNSRLPDPEFDEELPGRGPFRSDALEERRRRSARSWDPKLAPDVRALGTRLLAQEDEKAIGTGAFMLQAVGTPAEGPDVLRVLSKILHRPLPNRHAPDVNILDLPQPLPELVRTVRALRLRGWSIADPQFFGEVFAYFALLEPSTPQRGPIPHSEGDSPERPKEWERLLASNISDAPFPIREAAVRSIPTPMPEACVAMLHRSLTDKDDGVSMAACDLAGRSKRPEFIPPLLEIVATEHQEWLVRSASNAASELGARYELAETWVERLSEEKLFGDALDYLVRLIDVETRGGGGRTDLTRAERLALRKAWRTFLQAHDEELRAGRRIDRNHPTVTTALFGRARTWTLSDGTNWELRPE